MWCPSRPRQRWPRPRNRARPGRARSRHWRRVRSGGARGRRRDCRRRQACRPCGHGHRVACWRAGGWHRCGCERHWRRAGGRWRPRRGCSRSDRGRETWNASPEIEAGRGRGWLRRDDGCRRRDRRAPRSGAGIRGPGRCGSRRRRAGRHGRAAGSLTRRCRTGVPVHGEHRAADAAARPDAGIGHLGRVNPIDGGAVGTGDVHRSILTAVLGLRPRTVHRHWFPGDDPPRTRIPAGSWRSSSFPWQAR